MTGVGAGVGGCSGTGWWVTGALYLPASQAHCAALSVSPLVTVAPAAADTGTPFPLNITSLRCSVPPLCTVMVAATVPPLMLTVAPLGTWIAPAVIALHPHDAHSASHQPQIPYISNTVYI